MRNQWSFGRVLVLLLCLTLSVAACVQPLAVAPPSLQANQRLAKLVGSWQVETTVVQLAVTFPALFTFTSDGILITDEPPTPFETSGHGNWVATGPATADFTFLALIGSAEGALSATLKVVGSLQYEGSNDTWAGPFTIQVTDATGTEILADQGTFKGTRIAIEQANLALQPPAPVEFVRKIDTSAQKIQNSASLAVDSQGNVYVTDSSDTPRVLKYDNLGNFVLTWGEPGSGEGQFTFIPPNPDAGPTAGFVAVDAEDNVYVSDAYNFRVQKFDANGNFLLQFGSKGSGDGQFDEPTAGPIYVDSQGNIYVSTFPRVQKFDAAGNFLAAYGTAGTEDGQFNGAALGTIDREGNLYVADFLSARVQKLDASGQFLLKWGSAGTEAGQFTAPVTIVQDKAEKLYVADNSDRIQIFDTDGNFLGQWRETGGGNPPLTGAIAALAIDSDDNIYVSDTSPSIYVFHPR